MRWWGTDILLAKTTGGEKNENEANHDSVTDDDDENRKNFAIKSK